MVSQTPANEAIRLLLPTFYGDIIIINHAIVTISPAHLSHHRAPPRQAFSLTEMLIVIAIMGIMSAAVIAFMGGSHRENMTRVRNQRNAQEVVSLCMGAAAVGAPVIKPGDMRGTIQNLMEGRHASSGIFAGRIFQISEMSEEEIEGTMQHLSWRNGQPVYTFEK